PLAEPWNGTSWSLGTAAAPAGASVPLDGVSCTAANACTAVGSSANTAHPQGQTLAERWNGSSWAIQTTPNPFGSDQQGYTGVSCAPGSWCTAVGNHAPLGGMVSTLAAGWHGGSWSNEATPAISGANFADLLGVSCTSSSACMGVGYYYLPA